MRLGISGKGGVGKTTLTALICWALKELGEEVLAVDADPDTNLAMVLGFPNAEKFTPIIQMKELIEERMQIQKDRTLFKLNPRLDDIPKRFIKTHDGIKLMVMGTVRQGNGGCICPENAFLRRLLYQLILTENQHIVVDFEAGVEHLGGGTASKFDHLIVVVEPTNLSLETFKRIYSLAKDIGIRKFWAVANKIKDFQD
jgi:CO dehydrogenase maturation factor